MPRSWPRSKAGAGSLAGPCTANRLWLRLWAVTTRPDRLPRSRPPKRAED